MSATSSDERERATAAPYSRRASRKFFDGLFPSTENRALDDARNSILTEAVLAYEAGERWVSYSRRRDFYANDRYHGTPFTFDNTNRGVEWAVGAGLLAPESPR